MDALKELLYSLGTFCIDMIRRAIDWFLGLDILNRVVVVNTATAFLAVVLPIAKYYIFESWFVINNPLAVYMIGIAVIMFATIFFSGRRWVLPLRLVVNAWYLVSLIYIWGTHTFSHAPYVISYGIFFNLAAPVVYLAVSVMIFLEE